MLHFEAFLTSVLCILVPAPLASALPRAEPEPGMVFAMTNSAAGNEVLVYSRAIDGTLSLVEAVSTGGLGSGDGLGSQGALFLNGRLQWLLAVNAGSNQLSLFEVTSSGIELADIVDSGGTRPISVTMDDFIVYVLHAGVPNNVTGFRLTAGQLDPIPGSTRPLSADFVDPAQVSFDSHGDHVIVTEKATNLIDLFDEAADGTLQNFRTELSSGATPFGFGFAGRRTLIVSEAFGGAVDESAVSSYRLDGGDLTALSPTVATTETAACWIAITHNNRFAYTTNTGSDSISGYAIDSIGQLTLLDADGVTAITGGGPTDMAFSTGSRFLYIVNAADGTISAFERDKSGALASVQVIGGLPAVFAAGIVAF